MGEHYLRCVREPALVDMEPCIHDRIEVSTNPYLPPKIPKQNQHYSKQGCKVDKIRECIPPVSTQRKKANRLRANVYFVEENIKFASVKS